jgi:type I phosphodiesterase/nucleotide pyrophosphatase
MNLLSGLSWLSHVAKRNFCPIALIGALSLSTQAVSSGRNVIIFVADGLRQGSVNPDDAPTLYSIRQKGVFFANSHALFPTFTTPNASAIATGHYLGDTGDFSNTIYTGYPVAPLDGSQTPFIESDTVLSDIDLHFGGNFLDEETLLAVARKHGYHTATVGKVGPTLIQDVSLGDRVKGAAPVPTTAVIDDATGKKGGIPVDAKISEAMTGAHLALAAPDRTNGAPATDSQNNGYPGNNESGGTLAPNQVQQQYFTDVLTKAILPTFLQDKEPFVVVYWSRDPDGTQHNQGDSLNQLRPGINGPTSKAAVRNADNNLKQILDYLQSVPGLLDDTDLFVTSDHGFSTISKHALDSTDAQPTNSYAATKTYRDPKGRQEVNTGFLPFGFVAIDLAHHLNLPLFDPDRTASVDGKKMYKPVKPDAAQTTDEIQQRPAMGSGLIGGTGAMSTPTDAKVIVAANGGSDLIYLPTKDQALLQDIADFLGQQDYVSGLFSDPAYGPIKGALPLSEINLKGAALLPTPAMLVSFRSFSSDPSDPIMTAVTVCDTGLQQGQGMHGSFSRADTLNSMAAIGPDFKKKFVDDAPVSNADIARTLAHILKLDLPHRGELTGRVIEEALAHGPPTVQFTHGIIESQQGAGGAKTSLAYQLVDHTRYFDAGGFLGRTVGLPDTSGK